MQTTGRFWLSMASVAGAGFLIALATHVGTWTKGLRLRMSPGTFALAFLPVLVVVGWLLVATQPGNGWEEGKLDSWSNSIGILGVVHSVGLWHGVLAFAFGLMLGLSLDGVPRWSRRLRRPTPARQARAHTRGGRAGRSRAPLCGRRVGAPRDSDGGDHPDADPDTGWLNPEEPTSRPPASSSRTSEAAADPCREGSR